MRPDITTTIKPPALDPMTFPPSTVSDETHVVQRLVVSPDMPLWSFMALFIMDDDCGLRFTREVSPGYNCEIEIIHAVEGAIRVSIGAPR